MTLRRGLPDADFRNLPAQQRNIIREARGHSADAGSTTQI